MRRILWWILGPLLVLSAPWLVAKLVTGLVVTFRTGTLYWLAGVTPLEWMLMAAVATWAALALMLRREDAKKRQEAEDLRIAPPFVVFWSRFRRDLVTVNDMSFEDVLWTVRVPMTQDADGRPRAASSPPDFAVKLPPRCPKCGFDLKESAGERAFRWQCTSCPFQRLSRRRFSAVAGIMRRIARQAWNVSDEIPAAERRPQPSQ